MKAGLSLGMGCKTWELDLSFSFFVSLLFKCMLIEIILFLNFFKIWTNSSGKSRKLDSTSILLKCGSNRIHMYRNYATTSSMSTGTGGSTHCRTVTTVFVHLDWSWIILHRVRPCVLVLMCPHTDVSAYLCVHVPIHKGLGTGTHRYRKIQAYYIYLYWSWTTWSCTWFSNTGVSNYTTVSTT